MSRIVVEVSAQPKVEIQPSTAELTIEESINVVEIAPNVHEVHIDASEPATVEISARGLRGPKGDSGGGTAHVHTQAVAAATWIINHNLGFRPSVELIDASGAEFDGEIIHASANQTFVYLDSSTAGLARLT